MKSKSRHLGQFSDEVKPYCNSLPCGFGPGAGINQLIPVDFLVLQSQNYNEHYHSLGPLCFPRVFYVVSPWLGVPWFRFVCFASVKVQFGGLW